MIFSYSWLKDYIKGKMLTSRKLAEILTKHSFEVEEVKKVGKDWVLDIDVLPNRACDCFSHIGIAHEVTVLTNSKFQIPNSKLKEEKNLKAKDFVGVEVKNKEDCPRYAAKVILGVEVKSSPKWIKERLRACGLQPINNIVDITNYVMLETGQPIHAFDFDKIKSENSKFQKKKIIVRRAKKGEKITALDDKTYTLDEDILVIADTREPIAIAGIKGGESTGIDSKTKNIVIEAANFNPRVIRRASRKLKLRTDASWRFENGVDPNLIDFAQERVCSLIQEIAGGKVAQGMVDFYPKKARPKKIKLDLKYVERLLGVRIPKEKIIKILKNLGFKVAHQLINLSTHQLLIEVPTWRLDISIQEDLIEEIGRIAGFQNIPSVFPKAALIPPERNEEIFWQRNCQDILKEQGFTEVYNYSFIGEKEKEIFGWRDKEIIELANPISSFNKYLRPSLIPNLLKNVKENLKFFDEIKIFEIGKIFRKCQMSNVKCQILEKKMLGGVIAKKRMGDEGFYELKGIVDLLLNKLGISNVWYDDYQQTPEESHLEIWHPRKSAEIKTDGQELGFLGEIHPKILEELEIAEKVFVFDLNFEKLKKLASEEHEYQPISIHPAAVRDLAVLVPLRTKTVEVLNVINAAGGKLVRDVDLFDVYSGEGIPEGKENLAFHIIYQAEDRTLSSKEIDEVHQRIIKALEENPEWEVRK
ncbi:MAG: phenylalanine--tRNA ligase subunit beta [Candidatus Nealsonbacteria bacterium]|nr:MAG: phenylalanine--tRNA ligase subunit beta [Candidatus Nealsonbacteria bacterium]